MASPDKTLLCSMDYVSNGAPFVAIEAKTVVSISLDFVFQGMPFVGVTTAAGGTMATCSESVSIKDTSGTLSLSVASVQESSLLRDSPDAIGDYHVSVTESVHIGDFQDFNPTVLTSQTDSVHIDDTVSAILTGNLTGWESIHVVDICSVTMIQVVFVTESCQLHDDPMGAGILNVAAEESAPMEDLQSTGAIVPVGITESVSLGDSSSFVMITDASMSESVSLGDSSSFVSVSLASVTESMSIQDTISLSADATMTESVSIHGGCDATLGAVSNISTTYHQLQDKLYDWVSLVLSGISIVWSNQDIPKKAKAFVLLNILSLKGSGQNSQIAPDPNGRAASVGNRELTLSIQYFGSGCFDGLDNLKQSLRLDSYLQFIKTLDLAFVRDDDIQNITGLVDQSFEPRASYQVVFRYSQVGYDDVGIIEHIGAEKTFKQPDGATIVHNLVV
jgi:hypothetical protein